MIQYVLLDPTNTFVVSWFASPQPQNAAVVALADTDAKYLAYQASQAIAPKLAALLKSGLAITSTGTPALNGTYATDFQSCSLITSEQVYIATTGKFTNGQTTRTWLDASNVPHTFPSTAAFTAFAEAMASYVDALYLAAQAGGTSWPTPSATIA